jgi:hypothetical protein
MDQLLLSKNKYYPLQRRQQPPEAYENHIRISSSHDFVSSKALSNQVSMDRELARIRWSRREIYRFRSSQ